MPQHMPRVPRSVLVAAALGGIIWVSAGNLNPPPGAVTPTMKTLAEVEPRTPISSVPFTIDQRGSYYLTRDLIGGSGVTGITIANNTAVTLDLNGFRLVGVSGSLDGILVSGPLNESIEIKNGTVSGWGGDGVDLGLATFTKVSDLRILNNGGAGITGRLQGITVRSCTVKGNGLQGIAVTNGSLITDCVASSNTGSGIKAGTGSTISRCVSIGNGSYGFEVIGSVLSQCIAISNTDDGFHGSSNTVSACRATTNGGDGFDIGSGSRISACSANSNAAHGIRAATGSFVLANTCKSNGTGGDGAGILVSSADARIEGNTVSLNDLGISVLFGGNLIIRNSASGNTGTGSPTAGFDIPANNSYGPIVDVAFVGDISSVAAAAHPWANFEY